MNTTVQQEIAAMLGLPSLRPFQHEIITRLSHQAAYQPKEPNTTLVCLPTGHGKSYPPLVLLAEQELVGNKTVVIVECPLNRAMEGVIEKARRVKEFVVLVVPNDMEQVSHALTTDNLLQNTLICYNAIDEQVDNHLVSLMARSAIGRVKAFFLDEIALAAFWKDRSFRPLLAKMYRLLDAFRKRHSIKGQCVLQPSVVIQTAAATTDTINIISNHMRLPPTHRLVVSPDRQDLCLRTRLCTPAVRTKRIVDEVKQFMLRAEAIEKILILVEGEISWMQTLRKSISDALNSKSPYTSKKEPVRLAFSGNGCPNQEYECREFARERVPDEEHPSCRVLIMPASFGGIGTDFKNVTQVIHVGPPKTKELAWQFAGRCRGPGMVLFLLTWQQHCANLYHIMVAIASQTSDPETVEFNNIQRNEVNATTAALLYPTKCLRQLLEEPFLPPNASCCKTCRQLGNPLCSGCNVNEEKSLLRKFRESLHPWYETNNNMKNYAKMDHELDWSRVVNNGDYSLLLCVNDNCLKDFLVEHGATPHGKKVDHAKAIYDLCCPNRFNDNQMMGHVEQVVKAGEVKQMKEVVVQLSLRAKVPEYQAQDVIQRLLVHRILDNEPPRGIFNVRNATTPNGLGLWRVRRGKNFKNTRIPPLQPKERRPMKVSRRRRKKKKITH